MAIFGERERWSHRGRGYVKMETEWSDVATSRSRKKLGGCTSESSEVQWPSRHTTPDFWLENSAEI